MSQLTRGLRARWASELKRAEHRRSLPLLLDLRLLPAALGLWLVTFLINQAALGVLLAVGLGALLVLLVLELLGRWASGSLARHITEGLAAGYLVFLLSACQFLLLAFSGYLGEQVLLKELGGQSVRVAGRVLEPEPASWGYRLELELQSLSAAGKSWELKRPLIIYQDRSLEAGQQVQGVGTLESRGSTLVLKGKVYPQEGSQGRPEARQQLKEAVRAASLHRIGPDRTGLLLGMAYGDDSQLSQQARQQLKTAGLTHLTAVSGANISLIFLLVYRLAQRVSGWSPRPLLLLAMLATGIYVYLVGFDGSVLRAWAMGLLGTIGLLGGFGHYRLAMLSSSLLLLLFWQPRLASDIGFILSLLATSSLLILAPALSRLISHLLPLTLSDFLALPLAASLWTAPLLLLLNQQVYPYTVLANLLAAPLVAPITVCGLLFFLLSALSAPGPLLDLLLLLGSWPTGLLLDLASWVSALPASQLTLAAGPLPLLVMLLLVLGLSFLICSMDARLHRPSSLSRDLGSSPGSTLGRDLSRNQQAQKGGLADAP